MPNAEREEELYLIIIIIVIARTCQRSADDADINRIKKGQYHIRNKTSMLPKRSMQCNYNGKRPHHKRASSSAATTLYHLRDLDLVPPPAAHDSIGGIDWLGFLLFSLFSGSTSMPGVADAINGSIATTPGGGGGIPAPGTIGAIGGGGMMTAPLEDLLCFFFLGRPNMS